MPSVNISKRPTGRPAVIQQPLVNWLDDIGTWMIKFMSKNNRIATGDTINSFEIDIKNKPTTVILKADESVRWALAGRNKGEAPPIYAIEKWVHDKGVFGSDPITLNSIAWAVRTKIAKSGTNQPRLKQQQIRFAINQMGKKHLSILGEDLAKQTADDLVKAYGKIPNNEIKK